MTIDISTKTHVMVLLDGDKHYLTSGEAEAIKDALRAGNTYIEIDKLFFASHQFAKMMHGADYEAFEKRKRGDSYCDKHHQWIPKGKQCGYC